MPLSEVYKPYRFIKKIIIMKGASETMLQLKRSTQIKANKSL